MKRWAGKNSVFVSTFVEPQKHLRVRAKHRFGAFEC